MITSEVANVFMYLLTIHFFFSCEVSADVFCLIFLLWWLHLFYFVRTPCIANLLSHYWSQILAEFSDDKETIFQERGYPGLSMIRRKRNPKSSNSWSFTDQTLCHTGSGGLVTIKRVHF